LSISGELIPLLEAPKERRRKVVGVDVASGLLLEEATGLSSSLSIMAFDELWSLLALLSLGISQPPTPDMVSITGELTEWDWIAYLRSHDQFEVHSAAS
jgi:hypothetical protein